MCIRFTYRPKIKLLWTITSAWRQRLFCEAHGQREEGHHGVSASDGTGGDVHGSEVAELSSVPIEYKPSPENGKRSMT